MSEEYEKEYLNIDLVELKEKFGDDRVLYNLYATLI